MPPSDQRQPVTSDEATASIPVDEKRRPSPYLLPESPVAAAPHIFAEGELVAGRFRIIRFLGQGGMGQVYEAEDLELHERIALKTIHPEYAADERTLARFKQEIQLARKVTHPSVCRIFDLAHHHPSTGSGSQQITFLTMELLRGETLAQRLRRQGRITTEAALPIVEQVAAGLSAAHQAGVVHRDFKSSNVMLVPQAPDGRAVRAVVTDFGLARSSIAGDATQTAGSMLGITGTPAYMAPEQVKGEPVTAAADIYALGVVLYEIVTGYLPFTGDSPLSTAVKRLSEPPPPPRTRVPDLDGRWETAILRCLERDPADRFASATDLARALVGEAAVESKRRAKAARRPLLYAQIAIIALLVIVSGYWLGMLAPSSQGPVKPRRSIAIMGFKNSSGRPEAAWLSTALSEMLATELAAGEKLRAISGETVARTKIELALSDTDSFAKETLTKIRRNLWTDLVVLGSYIVLGEGPGGQIRLDLRLQDAAAGETVAAVAETGTQANLFQLVSQGGNRLRQKLGAGELPAAQAGRVRASLPSDPEAMRLYSEGLAKLRSFDILSARDLLEKAVAREADHPLARTALAGAWSALGYDARSREEARKAFDLSANLSREDRLLVEGRYWEAMKDWGKAIETYRTLFQFFPDNLDYGLRLSAAQTAAGKGKDALATLESLRKLPPPASDDPRLDLEEAVAANSLSDFRRQQAASARAAEKGAARSAQLLVASARIQEGRAFWELGEPAKSLAASEEAKRIYTATGDRWGLATAMTNLANVMATGKDLAGATRMHQEALAIYREIGNKRGMASALNNIAAQLKEQGELERAKATYSESLAIRREIGDKSGLAVSINNLANVLLDQGDLDTAAKMYGESLALCREIGEKRGAVRAMHNLAVVRKEQGDLPAAKSMLDESLSIRRQIGDKRGSAMALFNLALVSGLQGDLAGARKMYEEALAIDREGGNQRGLAYSLFGLGEIAVMEGNLDAARKQFEEALAVRERRGEKATAAETRLSLAALAIEEGRHRDAETLARSATVEFRREKMDSAAAQGHLTLARSLLARGRSGEARIEVERAAALLKTNTNLYVRLSLGIMTARVRAASGQPVDAVRGLTSLVAETGRAGLRGYHFEARLALGQAEIAAGDSDAGRARLAALESDATARGYGLIARKAAAARRAPRQYK